MEQPHNHNNITSLVDDDAEAVSLVSGGSHSKQRRRDIESLSRIINMELTFEDCACCQRPRQRAFYLRILLGIFLAVILYAAFIYVQVEMLMSSRVRGYVREEQKMDLLALAFLPLWPVVRKENLQCTPKSSLQGQTEQISDPSVTVAHMPELFDVEEKDLSKFTDFHLAKELTGCTPKFMVSSEDGRKYLFKPSNCVRRSDCQRTHTVWNELLAYKVSTMAGFHRVPAVFPHEIPFDQVEESVGKISRRPKLSIVHCKLDSSAMEAWLRSKNEDGEEQLIGTLQLMVKGVSKRDKMVNRARTKIGKWTDPYPPSVFAQREINTRSIFDFLIGDYDRYNNDFVQTQQPNADDRLLVYIDQGSFEDAEFLGTVMFRIDSYCRFYWQPVNTLRSISSLRELIAEDIESDFMTKKWLDQGLLDMESHPTMKYLDRRVKRVLEVVDKCVQQHGHDYVFLDV